MPYDIAFALCSPENAKAEMLRYTAEMRVRNLEGEIARAPRAEFWPLMSELEDAQKRLMHAAQQKAETNWHTAYGREEK